jgi:HEAT repeat protein/beta-lactamase regulating signal transducer with metallopeptidase domain
MSTLSAIAPVLLAMVGKGMAALMLAGGCAVALRRASAASRHLTWSVAMMALLVVPLLSLMLPPWRVAVSMPTVSDGQTVVPAPPRAAVAHDWPAPLRGVSHPARPVDSADATTAAPVHVDAVSETDWTALFALAWIAGTCALLCRLALGLARVSRICRRAEAVTARDWLDVLDVCAARLAVPRGVRLLASREIEVPMTCGWRAPVVLVPASAHTWSVDRRAIVFLHELAHVRRGDFLVHVLASVAAAVHWCNPLAWIAVARMRAERERACDDLVLASGARGSEYAEHLLDIARGLTRRTAPAAALAMARRSELEGRLLAILDTARVRRALAPRALAASWTLAAFALVPLASVRVTPITGAQPLATEADLQSDPAPAPPPPQPSPAQTKPAPAAGATAPQPARPAAGVKTGVKGGVKGGVVAGVGEGSGNGQGRGASDTAAPGLDEATRQRIAQSLASALHDADADVRQQAIAALVQMHAPNMFDPIAAAVHDSNAEVRKQAVHGLAELGDKRAVGTLIEALKDPNAEVREQAAWALGQFGAREAASPLSAALRDASADVREQAAWALGQLRDPATAQALAAAIKDANADVREQVAHALGELRVTAAVQPLVEALKDAAPDVRVQAAFALGQIASPHAIDALSAALKDVNAEVRQHVVQALSEIMVAHDKGEHDLEDEPEPPPQPEQPPQR